MMDKVSIWNWKWSDGVWLEFTLSGTLPRLRPLTGRHERRPWLTWAEWFWRERESSTKSETQKIRKNDSKEGRNKTKSVETKFWTISFWETQQLVWRVCVAVCQLQAVGVWERWVLVTTDWWSEFRALQSNGYVNISTSWEIGQSAV